MKLQSVRLSISMNPIKLLHSTAKLAQQCHCSKYDSLLLLLLLLLLLKSYFNKFTWSENKLELTMMMIQLRYILSTYLQVLQIHSGI